MTLKTPPILSLKMMQSFTHDSPMSERVHVNTMLIAVGQSDLAKDLMAVLRSMDVVKIEIREYVEVSLTDSIHMEDGSFNSKSYEHLVRDLLESWTAMRKTCDPLISDVNEIGRIGLDLIDATRLQAFEDQMEQHKALFEPMLRKAWCPLTCNPTV